MCELLLVLGLDAEVRILLHSLTLRIVVKRPLGCWLLRLVKRNNISILFELARVQLVTRLLSVVERVFNLVHFIIHWLHSLLVLCNLSFCIGLRFHWLHVNMLNLISHSLANLKGWINCFLVGSCWNCSSLRYMREVTLLFEWPIVFGTKMKLWVLFARLVVQGFVSLFTDLIWLSAALKQEIADTLMAFYLESFVIWMGELGIRFGVWNARPQYLLLQLADWSALSLINLIAYFIDKFIFLRFNFRVNEFADILLFFVSLLFLDRFFLMIKNVQLWVSSIFIFVSCREIVPNIVGLP